MEKFVVAALILGAGLGFGIGYLIFDENAATPRQNGSEVRAHKDTALNEAPRTKSEKEPDGKSSSVLADARNKVTRLEQELEREQAKGKKLQEAVQAKDVEIAKLKLPAFDLDKPITIPYDQLTEEQRALIKARGKEVLQRVLAAVDKLDKKGVLEEMSRLRDLGLAAKDEFFVAYDAVGKVGNPWMGPEMNKLGLSKNENASFMGMEVAHWVSNQNGENVSEGARIHSTYMIPWDQKVPLAKRASAFDNLFRTAKSPFLVQSAFENVQFMSGPEVGSMLIGLAIDENLDTAIRLEAMTLISREYAKQMSAEELSVLTQSSDALVRAASAVITNVRAPQASGYLISKFSNGSQGKVAGMQIGDILTHYNGTLVDSVETLIKWQDEAGGGIVKLIVWRGGEPVELTAAGGRLGIEGQMVKKD